MIGHLEKCYWPTTIRLINEFHEYLGPAELTKKYPQPIQPISGRTWRGDRSTWLGRHPHAVPTVKRFLGVLKPLPQQRNPTTRKVRQR
jgi:hypothetical protein